MQPETEGKEEKGPNHIPYINDPGKRPHPNAGQESEDEGEQLDESESTESEESPA